MNAIRGLTGGGKSQKPAEAEQLETLIATAKNERRVLESVVSVVKGHSAKLAFSEKKLADIEKRMSELTQTSADVEQQINTVVERGDMVSAVKAEIDGIHQVGAKSREDLQYVSDQRGEFAALRDHIESLLATAGRRQDTIAAIEAHRQNVEEVHSKTTLISNLLGDVRANLESVSEQKAVVDHIVDRLAKPEFVMMEAQNTLRMLNQERELAERIEQDIKQLRDRAGGSAEDARQLA